MPDDLSRNLASLRIDRSSTVPSKRRLRTPIWLFGIAVVGGLGLAKPVLEAALLTCEVQTTEVALVSPARASTTFTATGYVQAPRTSRLAPKVAGRVLRSLVQQGDAVEAGQLLLELDPADELAAIAVAKRQLATAAFQVQSEQAGARVSRAELAEAATRARRERRLAADGLSAMANAEDLEGRLESLEGAVQAALTRARAARARTDELKAVVQALRTNLANLSLVAPFAGVVVNEPPHVGEYVGPQPPGVIVDMGGIRVSDLSSLIVETDIPEARFRLLQPGVPAEIVLDAYPNAKFRGRVSAVTSEVDRAKATVRVKVAFVDATAGVITDLAARVSFLSEEMGVEQLNATPRKIVPEDAVVERDAAKVVFVVAHDHVQMQQVELGADLGTSFELIAGPAPQTVLVSNPPDDLSDGQRVRVTER